MAATPTYAFRYPVLADAANVPLDILKLATDVENKIITMDATDAANAVTVAAKAGGRLNGVTSVVDTNVTTTEAIINSFTFTAVSGRWYKLTADFEYYQKTGTAASNMFHGIRIIAGSTPTASAGTVAGAKYPNCGPAAFITVPATVVGFWQAPSSGTFAVSMTAKIDSGTGGIAGGAGQHIRNIWVEDSVL